MFSQEEQHVFIYFRKRSWRKIPGGGNNGINEGRQRAERAGVAQRQSEGSQELLVELDVKENKEVETHVQKLCGHWSREIFFKPLYKACGVLVP